jgi:hypothetical protein
MDNHGAKISYLFTIFISYCFQKRRMHPENVQLLVYNLGWNMRVTAGHLIY